MEATLCHQQKLSADIFWVIAKHHLDNPKDIFALARTNRHCWEWIRLEMYAKDITWCRFTPERWASLIGRETALVSALSQNMFDTAEYMIDRAIETWPEYLNVRRDGDFPTAIHLCAERGQSHLLKKLLDTKACDIGAIMESGNIVAATLINRITMTHPTWCPKSEPGCVDIPRCYTVNALTIAVACGHIETTKLLLDHEPTRTWSFSEFEYAAIPALHAAALIDSTELTTMLVNAGHDAFSGTTYFKGTTAFHLAVCRGNQDVIQAMCLSLNSTDDTAVEED